MLCQNCGKEEVELAGRCHKCAAYWYTLHRERPSYLIDGVKPCEECGKPTPTIRHKFCKECGERRHSNHRSIYNQGYIRGRYCDCGAEGTVIVYFQQLTAQMADQRGKLVLCDDCFQEWVDMEGTDGYEVKAVSSVWGAFGDGEAECDLDGEGWDPEERAGVLSEMLLPVPS